MTTWLAKCVLVVGLASGLAACLEDSPYRLRTTNPFNYKEVEWATKRGTNTLSGKILFPGPDGKTRPCDFASLNPDSAHNRERFTILYGGIDDKVIPTKDIAKLFDFQNPLRDRTQHTDVCGSRGDFSIRRIPDGVWYFIGVLNSRETGSLLLRRIEFHGNETIQLNYP